MDNEEVEELCYFCFSPIDEKQREEIMNKLIKDNRINHLMNQGKLCFWCGRYIRTG